MGTNRTVRLIQGWKLEISEQVRNDFDDDDFDIINETACLILCSDTYVTDGGNLFFGISMGWSRFTEYYVDAEMTVDDELLRGETAKVLDKVSQLTKFMIEQAIQKPARIYAVMEVSY